MKAAQADNAEVDLGQWAEDGGTTRVANAQAVLRRFVARWWAMIHQEKVALEWLRNQGPEACEEDVKAINDCIRRVMGCTYWS